MGDSIPFIQLKNVKNTHGGKLILVKLQAGAFHAGTNGTKSRTASHIFDLKRQGVGERVFYSFSKSIFPRKKVKS